MRPGYTEPRLWTSADGRRSDEIDVYIPASIADQHIISSNSTLEAAAERALHSLRGHLILRPIATILLRSEGIASSRIEGEVASTRRVFEAEYAPDDVSDHQAQRIVNSIRVMGDVIADAGQGVKPQDIDRWHALLFDRVPVIFEPGTVRTKQNWIGTRTDTPAGADFIPPPPELLAGAINDLAGFMGRVDVAPLTQAAVAHAQFETIHPYPDGNGRVGRALVYRSWAYRGVTGLVNPPISRVLVENREAYVGGLTAYRDGDVGRWLEFFFEVVQSAVSYTHSLGMQLDALNADWMERLAGTHEDALARRIVTGLLENPILSASEVAKRHDVTDRGARASLDDLTRRGILTFRPLRKARRGRPTKVYEATEFFELLDHSPRDLA
ncbi:MAG: Fic family protein [Actinomycetota bacterium]|nr:Fic family protein [Actinomycetota bacterium]